MGTGLGKTQWNFGREEREDTEDPVSSSLVSRTPEPERGSNVGSS